MNLTRIVDDFVNQVAQFGGSLLSTASVFLISPENLFVVLAGSGANAEGYVSPITFLAVSEFSFLLAVMAGQAAALPEFRTIARRTPFGPEFVWKAIIEGDWKKVGLLAVPFFVVVAIHAWLVDVAAGMLGHSLDFRVALGANCYFLGQFYFVCSLLLLVVLPWLGRMRSTARPWWYLVPLAVPGWSVILWGLYSYLSLLSYSLSSTTLKAFGVWALGTLLFYLGGALVALWMSPLLSVDVGRRTISPTEDVYDRDHDHDGRP